LLGIDCSAEQKVFGPKQLLAIKPTPLEAGQKSLAVVIVPYEEQWRKIREKRQNTGM
jgi:hypothetical protein